MISGQQQCSPASQWLSSSSASSPSSSSSCAGKPLLTLFKISAWFEKNTYTTRKGHFSLQNYKSQLPCRSSDVFKICGAMQLLSGLCLAIGKIGVQYILNFNTIIPKQSRILSLFQVFILSGILSFPAGWDNDEVRAICGEEVES